MKNIPILSFITRYRLLLVLLIVAAFAALDDKWFTAIGTLLYLPVLSFGALVVALLLRHVFYRQSIDADAHSGYFVNAWGALNPAARVMWSIIITGVLFLGVCIIASALVK